MYEIYSVPFYRYVFDTQKAIKVIFQNTRQNILLDVFFVPVATLYNAGSSVQSLNHLTVRM